MKFAIDRFENNLAILEEIKTKEKREIPISQLPKDIKEGTILTYAANKYFIDENEEELRRQKILEKFNRLKK